MFAGRSTTLFWTSEGVIEEETCTAEPTDNGIDRVSDDEDVVHIESLDVVKASDAVIPPSIDTAKSIKRSAALFEKGDDDDDKDDNNDEDDIGDDADANKA